jgi:predicted RNA-binding protein YlxR (DUF448 family)
MFYVKRTEILYCKDVVYAFLLSLPIWGRSPQGEEPGHRAAVCTSLPIWGRSPQVFCIPKGKQDKKSLPIWGRSPQGERGLKLTVSMFADWLIDASLPARGAWIEITARVTEDNEKKSLPARGAWIEMTAIRMRRSRRSSLPARGAWIEILYPTVTRAAQGRRSPQGERGLKSGCQAPLQRFRRVAPRKGSVD